MNKVEGLHHIAICTADMKQQIEFFTDKLGMELQALYRSDTGDTWQYACWQPGSEFGAGHHATLGAQG